MKRINLRELYPFYDNDFFLEVSDTVAELLKLLKRKNHADYERRRVHRAYYSLDADNRIERDVIFLFLSPEEIFERKLSRQELYAAIGNGETVRYYCCTKVNTRCQKNGQCYKAVNAY